VRNEGRNPQQRDNRRLWVGVAAALVIVAAIAWTVVAIKRMGEVLW
jgi:hypothetical protein